MVIAVCALALAACMAADSSRAASPLYPWLQVYDSTQGIATRIPTPPGYRRIFAQPRDYASWLRHLPLKPGRPPICLYTGAECAVQDAHYAVVDIDVGNRDVQQCADAIIRLRAEYLFSQDMSDSIQFVFTSGDSASWRRWTEGYRPVVKNNHVRWAQTERPDRTYRSFREYLDCVFTYAGTESLDRELRPVHRVRDLQIGDIFILPGSPGHAVLVVDAAKHEQTGEIIFLLAQGYMPAQSIHILKNSADSSLSPWRRLGAGDTLDVLGWKFTEKQLKRF